MIQGILEIFNEVFILNNNSHYLVGNGVNCNIRIQEDSIDCLHASIVVKDKIFIIDLNSKNGTYLNENLLDKMKVIEITKTCSLAFGKILAILNLVPAPSSFADAETSSRQKTITSTPNSINHNTSKKLECKKNETSTNPNSKNISANINESFFIPETQFPATGSCSVHSNDSNDDLFGNVEDEYVRRNILDLTKADEYYVPETQQYFTEPRRKLETSSKRKAVLSNIDDFENSLRINTPDINVAEESSAIANKSNETESQNLFDDLILTEFSPIADIKSEKNREKPIEDEISKITWKNNSQRDNKSNSSTPDIFEMNSDTSRSLTSNPTIDAVSNSAIPPVIIAKPKVRPNISTTTQSASSVCANDKREAANISQARRSSDIDKSVFMISIKSYKKQSDVLDLPLTQKFVPKNSNLTEINCGKKQASSDQSKSVNYDLNATQPFYSKEFLQTQVFPVHGKPNKTVTKLPVNYDLNTTLPFYPKESLQTQVFPAHAKPNKTVTKLSVNYDVNATQPFYPKESLQTQVFPAHAKPNKTVTKLPVNYDVNATQPFYPKESLQTQIFPVHGKPNKTVTKLPNPINKKREAIDPSQFQLRPLGKCRFNVFSSSDEESTDDEKSTNPTKPKNSKVENSPKNLRTENKSSMENLLDINFNCSPTFDYMKTPDIYSIRCIELDNRNCKSILEKLSPLDIFEFNGLKKKQTKNLENSLETLKQQLNKVNNITRTLRPRSNSTVELKEAPVAKRKYRKSSLFCPDPTYTVAVDWPPKGKKTNKENEKIKENVKKSTPKRSNRIKNLTKKK